MHGLTEADCVAMVWGDSTGTGDGRCEWVSCPSPSPPPSNADEMCCVTWAGSATPNPMDVVDEAMKQVDRQRSYFGAVQNRFESVIDGLNTNIITTSAAQSRIQDADYAQEVTNFIRAQLLQQVGIAMLTRVNQQPQMILRLLEGL